MVVKVVATPKCMQWSQPSVINHYPSSSSYSSSKRALNDVVSFYRNPFLGTTSSKQRISLSNNRIRRKSCTASFNEFAGGDFSREMASRLQFSGADENSGVEEYCPVKKAFSSMVFIIRELHSFSLQMRELVFYEDNLHGIMERVQQQQLNEYIPLSWNVGRSNCYSLTLAKTGSERPTKRSSERVKIDIHASFVWLFQQVFSHTPTLMVYIMILLANFTAYSLSSAIAAAAPPPPVTAKIEGGEDYFPTELLYQTGLAREPDNVLLLVNYAQFLYLVAHDYDRAEEYFRRAIRVEPKDAEAHSKYANFLWQVRNDLWAAEETFLEAISAEPNNSILRR